jgi:protein N-lysine methyltransferase METTL21D
MSVAKNTASDDDNDEETEHEEKGYCHFNDDGSNKTFSISLFGHDLDIEQDPSSQLLGHGAVVWDAAVIFSKYMEHDPKQFSAEKLHGKSVIELGSGCGLGGIAFIMKGAKVVLTDLQKVTEALTITNTNRIYMQLNSKGKGALPYPILPHSVRALDWTDFDSFKSSSDIEVGLFDIILLTDCVFSAALAVPLVDCILKLADTRCTVYCCHEIRDEVRLSVVCADNYLRGVKYS